MIIISNICFQIMTDGLMLQIWRTAFWDALSLGEAFISIGDWCCGGRWYSNL